MAFAPVIKGGNRPFPLLILESVAVVLLWTLLVRRQWVGPGRAMGWLLAGLAILPGLQLLPLPDGIWNALPGRIFYGASLGDVGVEPPYRAWSLIPAITEGAGLALLAPLAVFLATLATGLRHLRQSINLFVGIALIEASIGLAQYGTGWLNVFGPGKESIGRAYGTYANPDHLAGLLEMALPMALGLLCSHIRGRVRNSSRPSRQSTFRGRIRQLLAGGAGFNSVAAYTAVGLAILLGLIFTKSRTGIALAMFGIFLCAILFGRRLGAGGATRLMSTFMVAGLALALEIGLAPVLARFAEGGVIDATRWSVYSATVRGAGEFFPFGSGFGTYPVVFRRFHPGDVANFVNHAHNDYLEWLFEGGLPAGVLIVALLCLYVLQWRKVWPRHGEWSQPTFARISAGIALLLMGLHELIDFNLHIPANAIYFAFLAGVFFHPDAAPDSGHGARGEPSPKLPRQDLPARSTVASPAAAQVPNPFAE